MHLERGDEVYSVVRRATPDVVSEGDALHVISDSDLILDRGKLASLVSTVAPKYFYHLASVHGPSGTMSQTESDADLLGVGLTSTRLIAESIVDHHPSTRLVVALSSRMYSENLGRPINEDTPLTPNDLYGEVKAKMRNLVSGFRANFGLRGCSAILFNHDSSLKAQGYLSWDIAHQMAAVRLGKSAHITLRNPFAVGDFSHAEDICLGMLRQAEASISADYVFGSSGRKSVEEIVLSVSQKLNISAPLSMDSPHPLFASPPLPFSDCARARDNLSWMPALSFEDAIVEMVSTLSR
jgi:GDPmannose 4,6-dehydratase